MLNGVHNNMISLQDAVKKWCTQITTLLYECTCNNQEGVRTQPEMYYTIHKDNFHLVKVPDILHIKIRDRFVQKSGIIMSTTFVLGEHKYELKSGMLYMGNGEGGHWKCIVQKEDRLVIFDDEKEPVEGSSEDLKLGTDFIFLQKITV